jgi:ketosteroid isomerase-like protein
MKCTLFAVSAILTFQFAQAQISDADKAPRAAATEVTSVEDTIIQIEHAWGNALLKRDVAAWSRCLGDDWVITYSDGTLVTKPMALADLKEGALRIESFRLDDLKVRVYGDTAVVTGLITEKSKFRDKNTSGVRRFTDVFVKRDGRWQAIASHESNVSAPK